MQSSIDDPLDVYDLQVLKLYKGKFFYIPLAYYTIFSLFWSCTEGKPLSQLRKLRTCVWRVESQGGRL